MLREICISWNTMTIVINWTFRCRGAPNLNSQLQPRADPVPLPEQTKKEGTNQKWGGALKFAYKSWSLYLVIAYLYGYNYALF